MYRGEKRPMPLLRALVGAGLLAGLLGVGVARASNDTIPLGMNNNGEVVGFFTGYSGNRGFIYENGTFTDFSVPIAGSPFTVPRAVNDAGVIVGTYNTGPATRAFMFDGTTVTDLDNPLGTFTLPTSISNTGEVSGWYGSPGVVHGFTYDAGVFTTIDRPGFEQTYIQGANDLGQFVGDNYNSSPSHHSAFYYDGSNFSTLSGFPYDPTPYDVVDINNAGQIGGTLFDTTYRGYITNPGGGFTTIWVPGSPTAQTFLNGINDLGDAVGQNIDCASGLCQYNGFLYHDGQITPLIHEPDPPPPSFYTWVPEPSTWAYLIGGLLAVGGGLRRGRREAWA